MQLSELIDSIESELLACSEPLEFIGNLNIQEICADSRSRGHNTLFVAIRGFHSDGHNYLWEAARNGAIAAVVESIPASCPIPYLLVSNTKKCLGLLASAFYHHPSTHLKVIGVTGTNGKTTTTSLIHHLLSSSGTQVGLIGSPYTIIGTKQSQSQITTPDALALQATMHQMVRNQCSHVVMEVSSHGIELERISGIDFDIAVITNISADHMDLHGNQQNYIATKQRLFRRLAKNSIAIFNVDDASADWIKPVTSSYTIGYGLSQTACIRAQNIEATTHGSRFTLILPHRTPVRPGLFTIDTTKSNPIRLDCQLPITGLHNVSNALAAITTVYTLGLQPESIQQGLLSFRGVKRRLEMVYQGDFTIIDDYAHNPDGIRAVLETIEPAHFCHIRIVVAVRGNRGEQVNADNARVIVSYLNKWPNASIIVTNSEDVVTEKDRVSVSEQKAFLDILKQQRHPVTVFPTLREALVCAIDHSDPGDLILLLGAQGMDAGAELAHEVIKQNNSLRI